MRKVLISSRSFGSIVPAGEKILKTAGFSLYRITDAQRPLNEQKLKQIVARENPQVIVCGQEPITGVVLQASPQIKMVMKHGTGTDNIDIAVASATDILVGNAPGTNSDAVADLTLGAMLILLRGICQANTSTKAGGWERYIGNELGLMTVGIVGTGQIGAKVIKRLHGFEPKILACDQVQNQGIVNKYAVHYTQLETVLKESDIVSLHVPATEQTRNMIGPRELSWMKKTAFLLNLARGELVDEMALYEHLKTRQIAGAALDVFATEPPPKSPLLKLDNALVTPHVGAYTYGAMERMDRMCSEVIINTFQGKLTPNILNPEVFDGFKHDAEGE